MEKVVEVKLINVPRVRSFGDEMNGILQSNRHRLVAVMWHRRHGQKAYSLQGCDLIWVDLSSPCQKHIAMGDRSHGGLGSDVRIPIASTHPPPAAESASHDSPASAAPALTFGALNHLEAQPLLHIGALTPRAEVGGGVARGCPESLGTRRERGVGQQGVRLWISAPIEERLVLLRTSGH